jgi:hypothetical protein
MGTGGANHHAVVPGAGAPVPGGADHHPAHEQSRVLAMRGVLVAVAGRGPHMVAGARGTRGGPAKGTRLPERRADAEHDPGEGHQAGDGGEPPAPASEAEAATRLPHLSGGAELGCVLVET